MTRYNPKFVSARITSLSKLSKALNLSLSDFRLALLLPETEKYKEKEVPKPDGSTRLVYKPHWRIRRIQRRLNTRLFSKGSIIQWPDYLYGSIPNGRGEDGSEISKDYISCAQNHCLNKSAISIDIKNFFDNIHMDLVFDIYNDFFHFDDLTSKVLSRLSCRNGHLVQGGLNSSYLASLVLYKEEGKIVKRLERKGLTYTRYIDDITVSSKNIDYDYTLTEKIIENFLIDKDLPINNKKTKIQRSSSSPIMIHGLRVCYKEPRLPSDEIGRIRASVKNIETLSKEHSYRTTHAYRKDFNRCMGRVNKLKRVGHGQHKSLMNRLNNVKPIPSKKDIVRAVIMIENLERDHDRMHHKFWFKKRYFKAHERLNILKRSFPKSEAILRKRLNRVFSTYDD